MTAVNVVLLGLGNVGQAFATMQLEKHDELVASHKVDTKVIEISAGTHGCTFRAAVPLQD